MDLFSLSKRLYCLHEAVQGQQKETKPLSHSSLFSETPQVNVYNQLHIAAPIGMDFLAIQVRSLKMPHSNCSADLPPISLPPPLFFWKLLDAKDSLDT